MWKLSAFTSLCAALAPMDSSDALWDAMLNPPLNQILSQNPPGPATAAKQLLYEAQLAGQPPLATPPSPLRHPTLLNPPSMFPQQSPADQVAFHRPVTPHFPLGPAQHQPAPAPLPLPHRHHGSRRYPQTDSDVSSDDDKDKPSKPTLTDIERQVLETAGMDKEVEDMIMSNFWQLDPGGDFHPIRFHIASCMQRNVATTGRDRRKALKPLTRALNSIIQHHHLPLSIIEDLVLQNLLATNTKTLIPTDSGMYAMLLMEEQFQICATDESRLHEGRGNKRRFEWTNPSN